MLGIASLAGWNVILSSLDYFAMTYPNKDYISVFIMFPIPIMLTNFIAGLGCPYFATKFSYNVRITGGLIATCVAVFISGTIAQFSSTKLGYWITIGVLFI